MCPLLCSSPAQQFGDVKFMDGCPYWWMFSMCLRAATTMCHCSSAMAINQHPLSFFITAKSSRCAWGLCVLSQWVEMLHHTCFYLWTPSHPDTLDRYLPLCTGAKHICFVSIQMYSSWAPRVMKMMNGWWVRWDFFLPKFTQSTSPPVTNEQRWRSLKTYRSSSPALLWVIFSQIN